MEEKAMSGTVTVTLNGYWQSWQKLRRMARMRQTSMNSFKALNDLVSFRLVLSSNNNEECYKLLSGVKRFYGKYFLCGECWFWKMYRRFIRSVSTIYSKEPVQLIWRIYMLPLVAVLCGFLNWRKQWMK